MLEEKELLEEVADIGKDAAAEAVKIAAEEGHADAPRDIQEAPEGTEKIPGIMPDSTMEVEDKAPLQCDASNVRVAPPVSSLAMILAHPAPAAPSSSILAGVNFDWEISRILAPLTQRAKEARDPFDRSKDLAFLETVVAGLKDVQERYGQRWQAVREEHRAQDVATQQLKEKAEELRTWYNTRSRELRDQEEKMAAASERASTRDGRLTECEAQLNAKAKDHASHEQAMADTLHSKDEQLESLVQQ